MTGPHGAQTNPVATPSSTDAPTVASLFVRGPAQSASRDPIDTSGAIMRSPKRETASPIRTASSRQGRRSGHGDSLPPPSRPATDAT